LDPNDRINVALEIFMVNRFHAIPVVENDELIGILTTYDIIKALATEPVSSKQILDSQHHEGGVTEGIVG